MYAADINCIVRELQGIVGSRVDKVFQDKSGTVRIRFYGGPSGRSELLVEAGRRLHTTDFRRKGPKTPTSFAMYLRKHLGNKPLSGMGQFDFDRIVLMDFGELRLVVELFARGNLVLLDSESRVMLAMRRGPEERIGRGQEYHLPEPPTSPLEIQDNSDLREALKRKDLVRSLAVDLGLGRLYANELCEAQGLPKEAPPDAMTDGQASSVVSWLKDFRERIEALEHPGYYGGEEPTEYAPFRLSSVGGEYTITESLNQAADICYSTEEMGELESLTAASVDRQEAKLRDRLEIQESKLREVLFRSEEARRMGAAIYAEFARVSSLIDALGKVPKVDQAAVGRVMDELGENEILVGYSPKERVVTLRLGEMTVPIRLTESPGENAGRFYEEAKHLEKRAQGARNAIAKTERALRRSIPTHEVRSAGRAPTAPRKAEWYERFRWFFSSEDILVISGRDAGSNEVLVRRHLDDNDIYAHADVHGAPSTVVKAENRSVGETTIGEALVQCLIHSSSWKAGVTAGDAYWVRANQVTKRPTSGEFVAKGAFVIRGNRTYVRGMQARCGICWHRGRFMCGPLDAILAHSEHSLELVPGGRKKTDVAKEILDRLSPSTSPGDLDQIVQVLPAGRLDMPD